MKVLLLLLLLLPANLKAVGVFTHPERRDLITILNDTNVTLLCSINSGAGYFSFRVPPGSYSNYYPIYGKYLWKCN